MKVYAESSAVLAWLLGEAEGADIQGILSTAESVITSDLAMVECDRVLIRALQTLEMPEAQATDRRAMLRKASVNWNCLRIGPQVIERARHPFPGEPIRTLDAIHLASALVGRSAIPGLALLSLDKRIRNTGRKLGFDLLPST